MDLGHLKLYILQKFLDHHALSHSEGLWNQVSCCLITWRSWWNHQKCCGLYQRRLLGHKFRTIESISWAVNILDIYDPSETLNLSQGELLCTNIMSWVDILDQTRPVSQNQSYQSHKVRLVVSQNCELWWIRTLFLILVVLSMCLVLWPE